jgi:hypothetical protein
MTDEGRCGWGGCVGTRTAYRKGLARTNVGVCRALILRGKFIKWAETSSPGAGAMEGLEVWATDCVWPRSLTDLVSLTERFLWEKMKGFHDLLRQKPMHTLHMAGMELSFKGFHNNARHVFKWRGFRCSEIGCGVQNRHCVQLRLICLDSLVDINDTSD